jgi:hypothetical protein
MGDGVWRATAGLYGVIDIYSKEVREDSVTKRHTAWYSNDGSDFTVATGNAEVIIAHRYCYPQ